MAHLKSRVDALERKDKRKPDTWLIVQQDLDDPNLYHGQAGATYTDAQLTELANSQQVLRLDWQGSGRAPHPDEKRIVITWGDVEV